MAFATTAGSTKLQSHSASALRLPFLSARPASRAGRLTVRMSKADEPSESSSGSDSYSRIEAPVRQTIPDQGIPVSERTLGQPGLNRKLKSEEWNPDRKVLGTAIGIADSMRFHGAIPEVANSRLAMLGFALAVIGELTTGRNVFQQIGHAPGKVLAVFLLFIAATAVPVVRGVPRRSFGLFTSDAEIVNGRTAMLGFLGLLVITLFEGSYTGTLWAWLSS